jgi:hypothetical protein
MPCSSYGQQLAGQLQKEGERSASTMTKVPGFRAVYMFGVVVVVEHPRLGRAMTHLDRAHMQACAVWHDAAC